MTHLPDRVAYAYLERLDVDVQPGAVDPATLAALQRAHVARVPYENIDIYRGRPPGIARRAAVERVLAGRGGYCFHVNGAFSLLLEWLSVDLTRHVSGVQGSPGVPAPGPNGNHLALTVRTADGIEWFVDTGLGDGPTDPFPLVHGVHEQHGFRYELRPSAFDPLGWRFVHHPRGAFVGADVARAPATTRSFTGMHRRLSRSAASGFVRVPTVMRTTPGVVEILRGCVRSTVRPGGVRARDVDTADAWWSIVIDEFGLTYGDVPRDERREVWRRVRTAHEAWDAEGRP